MKYVAVDIETTGLDKQNCELLGVGVADAASVGSISRDLLKNPNKFQSCLLNNYPIFHNAAFDVPILRRYGFEVPKYHDTMLLGHLYNPMHGHSLEA